MTKNHEYPYALFYINPVTGTIDDKQVFIYLSKEVAFSLSKDNDTWVNKKRYIVWSREAEASRNTLGELADAISFFINDYPEAADLPPVWEWNDYDEVVAKISCAIPEPVTDPVIYSIIAKAWEKAVEVSVDIKSGGLNVMKQKLQAAGYKVTKVDG